MHSLELKIPPPVVALCLALLMWLASKLVEPTGASFFVRLSIAVALLLLGQSIIISGMIAFRKARTTINPFRPEAATSLVTTGVYRVTRNPMYVGLLVTLVGWAAFLVRWPAWLLLPLFVLYIQRLQIKPEERAMAAIFGSKYSEYRKRVRAWL